MKLLILLTSLLLANIAWAGMGFYTGESIEGLHKICYYNYMGETIAVTISSTAMCPLQINVD